MQVCAFIRHSSRPMTFSHEVRFGMAFRVGLGRTL